MDTGIGQPVRRREDGRLVTGKGTYSDDVNMPGQAYAVVVRSPHAHARILSIGTSAAEAVPGVLAVLTGTDREADGLNPIPHVALPSSGLDITLVPKGGEPFYGPHHILTNDKVRLVGEGVALVVAETGDIAKDAAELVEVDYEVLPSVTATLPATEPGAPLVWDEMQSNVVIDADVGDQAATDAAFEKAHKVVRLETWVRRVTGVPMEPRSGVAAYDPETGRFNVHWGGGGVVRPKRELSVVMGVEFDDVRVTAKDIGGNFGTKNSFYPETALVAWAAKRIGRPVKYVAERTEAFLTDYQGRDLAVTAELALDSSGRFLAMRGSNLSNIGAYPVSIVPLTKGVEIMTGVYDIPVAYFRARGVYSNTASTAPYRSAGRPEVMFVTERLVDLAAREMEMDPAEIRRRNLVPTGAFPHENKLGMTYDSGDYAGAMERALELADVAGFDSRKKETEAKGLVRGLGIANYIETSTGLPRERSDITVRPEGSIDVVVGTLSSGQGHETSFTQVVSEWFGAPLEEVNLVQGDTDIVVFGGGSHSGRSMRLAGRVMGEATEKIIAKAKEIAAHNLEAAVSDIELARGKLTVVGTDRSLGIYDVAHLAETDTTLPEELRGPLAATGDQTATVPDFPFGCHICEVEVDAETGAFQIDRYSAVDDVGRAINPLILHGQAHGSIVQGLGQALSELVHYDPETGQCLSATFMDYGMPVASQYPSFVTEISEVPSTTNPLGIRAGGEGGTTPALAVVVNAVVDALADFGVSHLEMPLTAESIWRAVHDTSA
ncbi:MAG: xanthine dehydrogenase family protein molybdopterin-binding subunit [Rhodospirillales bacterium]|nr:xanthine dehydrogenase family protein molybdopterin-binding subunit [Rhodospirillales bacterium]